MRRTETRLKRLEKFREAQPRETRFQSERPRLTARPGERKGRRGAPSRLRRVSRLLSQAVAHDGDGKSPLAETIDMIQLEFRRLHMQFGGQAELAGLGLRFSPGGKSVTSDAQLLERILSNLVQNAIKHTTRGGVVVVARTTAETLNLEVWDTGCGIAPGSAV